MRAGDSRDAKQRNRFQHQAPSTYMGVSQKFLERHKHDKYPPKEVRQTAFVFSFSLNVKGNNRWMLTNVVYQMGRNRSMFRLYVNIIIK